MKNLLLILSSTILATFFATTSLAKPAELLILQQDRAFVQDGAKISSLVVKTGDVLRFKNGDPFAHNVFSLSPLKNFDLGSYPKGKSKTVIFNKKGTAEIECAIHPQMFLEVTVE